MREAKARGPPPAPAAVARKAGLAGAWPRVRAVRPQPRRAGLAPAQDGRGRRRPAALYTDRVGCGLRVRAGRNQLIAHAHAHGHAHGHTHGQRLVGAADGPAPGARAMHAPGQEPFLAHLLPPGRAAGGQHPGLVADAARAGVRAAHAANRAADRFAGQPEAGGAGACGGGNARVADENHGRPREGGVRGEGGLWVGLDINGAPSWLLMERSRFSPTDGGPWLVWLVMATALSLTGAAAIARLVNRPLKQLSYAANRVKDGDFAASHLDEEVAASEIREVNIGFNRMAQKLAKLEQDRAVMLAGISHDLRTPLARLRLETEMSVADEVAREHMVADIVQLDATIDKFLDSARPDHVTLEPINLHAVVSSCVYAVQEHHELQITLSVPEDLNVLVDEVELARVISNLLENARRYGKTPDTGIASVDIEAKSSEDQVLVKLRDHGAGVPPEQLSYLIKPFFRGDMARTSATGAGLGLSIVDKTMQRMGGVLSLANANDSAGGLVVLLRLQRAIVPPKATGLKQRLLRPAIKRQLPPLQAPEPDQAPDTR